MITEFTEEHLKELYIPSPSSHKGQNGKLLIIGGSTLFHAASLWALTTASRVVDMVFYASVPSNNQIVQEAKEGFRDGIVVDRLDVPSYIAEADCVLIGPGMVRASKEAVQRYAAKADTLDAIQQIEDEGVQTYYLTKHLLERFPHKKWVIDAGALQMMDPEWLQQLSQSIVTPHHQEFVTLFGEEGSEENIAAFAKQYTTTILLKGKVDLVSNGSTTYTITGGNAGMTKGGTGDVLAGLVAALACNNDMLLAAAAGSLFNKRAGDALQARVGIYYNASDLSQEIPHVMKDLLS